MHIDLTIHGMDCDGCVRAVERVLKAQPGVRDASADLAAGRAAVDAEPGTDPRALAAAIEAAGYGAEVSAG